MVEVLIRAATGADLPAIVALEQEAFPQPWSEASLQGTLADNRTLLMVAESGGTIVGYGTAWCVGDEAEITRLAVPVASRRGGIGAGLLCELLDGCIRLGAARVFLEVRSSNEAALGLYQKAGFAPVGLRRRYYENGEDAVVMSKELNGKNGGME